MAGAPPDHPGDQLVALVGIDGLDELDHHGCRVPALPLLHVEHPFHAVDGVAGAKVAKELPVVAGKEPVDSGQAPTGTARPVPHIWSAGVADDGAVLGIGRVFLVAVYRVGVADTVYEVEQRPHRGVADEVFGTQPGPDHCLGVGDGFGGDTLHLGECFRHPLLLVSARHEHPLSASPGPPAAGPITRVPVPLPAG